MKNGALIAGVFLVIWLGPAIVATAMAAFIHLDVALLNPTNWPMGARVLTSVWTVIVIIGAFCAVADSA